MCLKYVLKIEGSTISKWVRVSIGFDKINADKGIKSKSDVPLGVTKLPWPISVDPIAHPDCAVADFSFHEIRILIVTNHSPTTFGRTVSRHSFNNSYFYMIAHAERRLSLEMCKQTTRAEILLVWSVKIWNFNNFPLTFLQVDVHSMSRAQRVRSSMHWKNSFLATIQTPLWRKSKSNKICRRFVIVYSNRVNRSTVAANAASIRPVCCASIASNSLPTVCTSTKLAHRRATDAVIAAIAKHGNVTVIVMNTR